MHTIDEFVNQLVAEKGFADKDPEIVAQIKADLLERINDRVNAMIINNMPEDALDGFEKAIDMGGKEGQDYARKYIPDLDEKVASALLSFKSTYLS